MNYNVDLKDAVALLFTMNAVYNADVQFEVAKQRCGVAADSSIRDRDL